MVLEMKFTLPDTRSDNGLCHRDRLSQGKEKHMDSFSFSYGYTQTLTSTQTLHVISIVWIPLSVQLVQMQK